MFVNNKEAIIRLLQMRVAKLRESGEQMNHGLIAKALRQIRKLEAQ